ncbi:DUF1572 domain-containing protein [Flavobacteriaceae bacterium]|nr:DUF1572 domain-containing protein [Flavobacteriaceae bacterium]
MGTQILNEFKIQSIFRLKEGYRMVVKALDFIDEKELWQIPVENGMSLGNQILHSCGNMRQYIISSLGNQIDSRKRDLEFKTKSQLEKKVLLKQLKETIDASIQIIKKTNEQEYLKVKKVQAFSFSGIGLVLHAVEHFSYHVGQIAFWVKFLTQKDLGFYNGIDLAKNN